MLWNDLQLCFLEEASLRYNPINLCTFFSKWICIYYYRKGIFLYLMQVAILQTTAQIRSWLEQQLNSYLNNLIILCNYFNDIIMKYIQRKRNRDLLKYTGWKMIFCSYNQKAVFKDTTQYLNTGFGRRFPRGYNFSLFFQPVLTRVTEWG